MKKNYLYKLIFLLCLLSLAPFFSFPSSKACAPVPRLGGKVTIADESAIIIWNSKTKTEHFIRNAVFDTSEKDFGFLVPTPSVPTLAEMEVPIFIRLLQTIQPKVQEKTENEFSFFLLSAFFRFFSSDSGMAGNRPLVRIVDQQQLGSYDTVILEADDADALATWLESRGYAKSPSLSEWLTPYIAMKWKITAFRIIQPVEDDPIYKNTSPTKFLTTPIQISFTTDEPFFPYREPKEYQEVDNKSQQRNLQVFFFSDSKVTGAIKDAQTPWPGRVIWAGEITDPSKILGDGASLTELPKPLWLTAFEDSSSPRPGTNDLFFSPDKNQDPISLPPIISINKRHIVIPLDLIIPIIGILVFWYFRKKTS